MVVIPHLKKYWTKVAQRRRFCWSVGRQRWRSRGLRRKNGANGLSTERSNRQLMLVNSPWEPGGRKRKVEEKGRSRREQVKVFKKGRGRSRYGGGGKLSGGFVGGVPWGFAGIHGGGEGLKKMRMMEEGRWRCDGNYGDGGGVAGIYGVDDWYGGERIVPTGGKRRDGGKWRSLNNSRSKKKIAEEASKGISVNDPEDDLSNDVKDFGSHLPGKSYTRELGLSPKLKLKIYPSAEREGDGPASLYSNPISLQPIPILNHSQYNHSSFLAIPLNTKRSDFSFNPDISSTFLGSTTVISKEFPISLHDKTIISPPRENQRLNYRPKTHLTSYVLKPQLCTPLNYSLNHNPTNFTLDDNPTELGESSWTGLWDLRHDGAWDSLMQGCLFLIHLEDKVDLWAAGSGKYGGADGMGMGTSGKCKRGWQEHDPGPGRLLKQRH